VSFLAYPGLCVLLLGVPPTDGLVIYVVARVTCFVTLAITVEADRSWQMELEAWQVQLKDCAVFVNKFLIAILVLPVGLAWRPGREHNGWRLENWRLTPPRLVLRRLWRLARYYILYNGIYCLFFSVLLSCSDHMYRSGRLPMTSAFWASAIALICLAAVANPENRGRAMVLIQGLGSHKAETGARARASAACAVAGLLNGASAACAVETASSVFCVLPIDSLYESDLLDSGAQRSSLASPSRARQPGHDSERSAVPLSERTEQATNAWRLSRTPGAIQAISSTGCCAAGPPGSRKRTRRSLRCG
jgi:hypothetical protein